MGFERLWTTFRSLFGGLKMKADTAPHLKLGQRGEEFAIRHLQSLGCKILDRNWRHGHLELDAVCLDGGCLVFVEVKTRHTSDFGGPEAGITPAKKKRLTKCALHWLQRHSYPNLPVRFDVLCLTACGDSFDMEHYRNAFDFSPSVGNSHTSWQPW